MLIARIGPIPGAMGQQWNHIATSCHFASVFWLFHDEFGRVPTQNEFLRMADLTGAIRRMLPFGTRLNKPAAGHLVLTPGNIVVFVHDNQPVHSCSALDANTLAGYNQVNWFKVQGENHRYTTHQTNEIRWGEGLWHGNEVTGNVGQWCKLIAIPERPAKAVIRSMVQG